MSDDRSTDDGALQWGRIYLMAAVAGAVLGILAVLGLLPDIPHQLTEWMRSVDPVFASVMVILGGVAIGVTLAAIAHLGVYWQLRRRASLDG